MDRHMSTTPSRQRQRAALRGAALAGLLCTQAVAAQALTDPLRPPLPAPQAAAPTAETTPAPSGYTLQATQVSRARRHAVINGRAVSEGDALDGGARVASIQHGSVQLAREEGPLTLYVTSSIRQPPAGAKKSAP